MTTPDPTPVSEAPFAPAGPLWPEQPDAVPLEAAHFRHSQDELYRQLRRDHGPVLPVLLEGQIPVWMVLGYREMVRVTTDSNTFARDSRRWHSWDKVPPDWELMTFVGYRPTMLFTEGAEHERRAEAIIDSMEVVDPYELRALCERVADNLIDTFAGRGHADLITDYACQIPLRVLNRMYGLGPAESDELQRVTVDLVSGVGGPEAHQNMVDRMVALLQQSRANPDRTNIATVLAFHPAGLTDDEIINDLLGNVYAAHQPTTDLIGNALRLMLTDERFAVTMSGGRRSVGQAINEVLWEAAPVPNWVGRWAAEDTMLAGRHIRKGDCLMLSLAAANADPDVRPDFRAGAGGNQAHMAFSHGTHGCPQVARDLAEAIAMAAIEVLIDRLPDVSLTVAPEELEWRSALMMRGVSAIPVEFTPTSR
ncbi:cytochrome P450 [Streptomyces sp. ME19-01-6]|uniref:cytochrome P450 n=1 Tax=Streptomyces sp. ME19-01-6 TaxID=3028686 RepID=UPI0029A5042D|nr:cytochrome P450 [Streptomyces sp. ME19-01-6]MDX3226853.1 cytochrome P450 [Streptomyces sp. ME19-01-6]